MNKISKAGIHLNASKIWLKKEKVLFLGYDVFAAKFRLDANIHKQNKRLLKVTSKSKIIRVFGAFNVCKEVCSDLAG